MKTKLVCLFSFTMLLTTGAYAQDSTAMSKKEMRRQEIKRKARVANEGIEKGAKKVGEKVNKGLDKAEAGLINERDKLRAKRDSSKAEKARQDSL